MKCAVCSDEGDVADVPTPLVLLLLPCLHAICRPCLEDCREDMAADSASKNDSAIPCVLCGEMYSPGALMVVTGHEEEDTEGRHEEDGTWATCAHHGGDCPSTALSSSSSAAADAQSPARIRRVCVDCGLAVCEPCAEACMHQQRHWVEPIPVEDEDGAGASAKVVIERVAEAQRATVAELDIVGEILLSHREAATTVPARIAEEFDTLLPGLLLERSAANMTTKKDLHHRPQQSEHNAGGGSDDLDPFVMAALKRRRNVLLDRAHTMGNANVKACELHYDALVMHLHKLESLLEHLQALPSGNALPPFSVLLRLLRRDRVVTAEFARLRQTRPSGLMRFSLCRSRFSCTIAAVASLGYVGTLERDYAVSISNVPKMIIGCKGHNRGTVQFYYPRCVSWDPVSGNLVIADYNNGRVVWIKPATGEFVRELSYVLPSIVAVNDRGDTWVAGYQFSGPNRISFYPHASNESEPAATSNPSIELEIVDSPRSFAAMPTSDDIDAPPRGVAVLARHGSMHGNLLALMEASPQSPYLWTHKWVQRYPSPIQSPEEMNMLVQQNWLGPVAILGDGSLIVVREVEDSGLAFVSPQDGSVIRRIAQGLIPLCTGLAITRDNLIIVAEGHEGRVSLWSLEGECVHEWGESLFDIVASVCAGPDDSIVCCDHGHHRLIIF